MRASGKNVLDTAMRDEEDDGPEGDRSPMDSDTYVSSKSDRRLFRLRQPASRGELRLLARIPKLEAP